MEFSGENFGFGRIRTSDRNCIRPADAIPAELRSPFREPSLFSPDLFIPLSSPCTETRGLDCTDLLDLRLNDDSTWCTMYTANPLQLHRQSKWLFKLWEKAYVSTDVIELRCVNTGFSVVKYFDYYRSDWSWNQMITGDSLTMQFRGQSALQWD